MFMHIKLALTVLFTSAYLIRKGYILEYTTVEAIKSYV